MGLLLGTRRCCALGGASCPLTEASDVETRASCDGVGLYDPYRSLPVASPFWDEAKGVPRAECESLRLGDPVSVGLKA